ncbi:MAG: ribosome recycling factor [candidate division FCPU426 bacterium]
MVNNIVQEAKSKMDKSVEVMGREFTTIRTGRATASLLDGVKVSYYGSETPLLQLAGISNPDARTLEIKPYDTSALAEIEKSIFQSNLGLTPQNDGKVVRISFPPLTEERRKDLVKVVRKMAEEARIAVRSIRRDANDHIKKLEKAKEISEDDSKGGETQIQKATDAIITRIDDLGRKKEADLMEV